MDLEPTVQRGQESDQSMSLNKVMLIGNLGRDPETRFLPDGGAVTNLSIGTTHSWKGDGKKTRKPNGIA